MIYRSNIDDNDLDLQALIVNIISAYDLYNTDLIEEIKCHAELGDKIIKIEREVNRSFFEESGLIKSNVALNKIIWKSGAMHILPIFPNEKYNDYSTKFDLLVYLDDKLHHTKEAKKEKEYNFLKNEFRKDLEKLVNKHNLEQDCNIPDFYIVQFILDSLWVGYYESMKEGDEE